jgi:hypothetical protein
MFDTPSPTPPPHQGALRIKRVNRIIFLKIAKGHARRFPMIDPQKWTRDDSKQELIKSHLFRPFEGSVGEKEIEMGKKHH